MKTAQTISRNLINRPSNNRCILKLERNNKNLQQLEKQFSSYIYEPTTYLLFTKYQKIRQSLTTLKKNNAELIASLKRERDLKIDLYEKTMLLNRSFLEIQKLFDEYSRQLRY